METEYNSQMEIEVFPTEKTQPQPTKEEIMQMQYLYQMLYQVREFKKRKGNLNIS